MLKIFIGEFITGGGMRHRELDKRMLEEAEQMFQSLLQDLRNTPELNIVCTRDDRLSQVPESLVPIGSENNIWGVWEEIIQSADLVWFIAPESAGVLLRLIHLAEQHDCVQIGCTTSAVKIAASKQLTSERLLANDIATTLCHSVSELSNLKEGSWIVKPDMGAGSQSCFVVNKKEEYRSLSESLNEQEEYVLQQFVPGQACSVSVLYNNNDCEILSLNKQVIKREGHYLYCEASIPTQLAEYSVAVKSMVEKIGHCIDGLQGYVGIDFIMTDAGPVVLDINPRLTTSYVALSKMTESNLASRILHGFGLPGMTLKNEKYNSAGVM